MYVADEDGGLVILRFILGPYSVSGQVRNINHSPIAGVNIEANAGISTITDATGYYTITGLITETYIITSSLTNYTFTPPTRTVMVPPNAIRQDFVGNEHKFLIYLPLILR